MELRTHRDALSHLEELMEFGLHKRRKASLSPAEQTRLKEQKPRFDEWQKRKERQKELKQQWSTLTEDFKEANRYKWIMLGYTPPW